MLSSRASMSGMFWETGVESRTALPWRMGSRRVAEPIRLGHQTFTIEAHQWSGVYVHRSGRLLSSENRPSRRHRIRRLCPAIRRVYLAACRREGSVPGAVAAGMVRDTGV
jgi:hypothetical protein